MMLNLNFLGLGKSIVDALGAAKYFSSMDWISKFPPGNLIVVTSEDGNIFQISGQPGLVTINGFQVTENQWKKAMLGKPVSLKSVTGKPGELTCPGAAGDVDRFIANVRLNGAKLFGTGFTASFSEPVKVRCNANQLF